VARAAERGQATDDEGGVVDRGTGGLVEPALQPASCRAPAALAVAECRERRELERVEKPEPGQLARGELGRDQVAAFDRPAEDRVGVAL
jgi:hypothetical protein